MWDVNYKKLRATLKPDNSRVASPLIFSSNPDHFNPEEGMTLTMGQYYRMLIKSWCYICLGGIDKSAPESDEELDIMASFLRAHILTPTAQLNLHRHDTLDAEEIKEMMKELYRNPDYIPHFAALPAFTLRSRDGGLFISLYTRS